MWEYLAQNMKTDVNIPLTNRVRGPYRKLRTEFFPPRFMAQARSARAINRRGKKRGSVTYSTDQENEVSKIFIISLLCVWGAQERFLFTRNGFKFLKAKRFDLKSFLSRQHAIIHNLEYKKVLNSCLPWKLRTVGNKSQNSLQQNQL